MQKAALVQASSLVTSGLVAASLGYQLAGHDVSIAVITATVAAVLSSGLLVGARLGNAARTTLYTCPVKGCTASIRAQGTTRAELERLRALAADHSKHGDAQQ